jgi:hypothetical protein
VGALGGTLDTGTPKGMLDYGRDSAARVKGLGWSYASKEDVIRVAYLGA